MWWQRGTVNEIWSNRYSPTTGWGTPVFIDYTEYITGAVDRLEVAIDPNGNATLVWQRYNGASYDMLSNRFE